MFGAAFGAVLSANPSSALAFVDRFLLGFPCSPLAAEPAQQQRALVAPRFAAHLCPLVLLARSSRDVPPSSGDGDFFPTSKNMRIVAASEDGRDVHNIGLFSDGRRAYARCHRRCPLGALPPAQASSAALTYYAAVAAAGWAGAGGNAATNSGSGGGSRRVLERYRVLEPTAVPADAQENPLLARVNVYLRGRSEHDRRDKRLCWRQRRSRPHSHRHALQLLAHDLLIAPMMLSDNKPPVENLGYSS